MAILAMQGHGQDARGTAQVGVTPYSNDYENTAESSAMRTYRPF